MVSHFGGWISRCDSNFFGGCENCVKESVCSGMVEWEGKIWAPGDFVGGILLECQRSFVSGSLCLLWKMKSFSDYEIGRCRVSCCQCMVLRYEGSTCGENPGRWLLAVVLWRRHTSMLDQYVEICQKWFKYLNWDCDIPIRLIHAAFRTQCIVLLQWSHPDFGILATRWKCKRQNELINYM